MKDKPMGDYYYTFGMPSWVRQAATAKRLRCLTRAHKALYTNLDASVME